MSLSPCTTQVMYMHAGAHVRLIVVLLIAFPSSSELVYLHAVTSDTEIHMGRPAGAKGKTEPERWTHAVAERLEQTRSTMPPWHGDLGKAGKSARWEVRQAAARRQAEQQPSRGGVWSREEEEEGSTAAREPVARVTAADVQQVTTMYHRTWGGLLATDFEPQRHSLMVLGRPVQAA